MLMVMIEDALVGADALNTTHTQGEEVCYTLLKVVEPLPRARTLAHGVRVHIHHARCHDAAHQQQRPHEAGACQRDH